MVENEYGVFSTDYIFNNTLNVQDARFIKRVGSTIVGFNEILGADTKFVGEGYWGDVFQDQPLQMMTELLSVPKTTSTLKTKVVPVSESDTPTEAGGFNSKCVGSAHDLNNEVNMYYYRKNIGNPSETISNRKFVSLPWLSFEIEKVNGDVTSIITNEELYGEIEKPSCYNLDVVNLTKEDPETLDILTWYDKQFLKYKIASQGIVIDIIDNDVVTANNIYLWNGDCFLQRTALRVLGWNPTNAITGQDGLKIVGESIGSENSEQYGWDWAEEMNNSSHIRYAHGLVLSIVTENKYNTNYRFRNRFGLNDYFENKLNDLNWIISCWKETTRESLLLNTGNSKILPDKEISIYPYFSPYNGTNHPTRIRFSNRYSPGSFLDANRQFESLHYRDFDYAFGEIVSIKNHNGMLISIQEGIIKRHYVNEKALQIDAEGQSLMLGSNPQYLTEQTYIVGEFGSKHQNSIYKTENGIYGVDFDRNIIWKTGYVEGGSSLIYKATDLSLNKNCRSWNLS